MSKTKPERIANIDERIAQLKNQQKLLRQQYNAQERKARNHRICRRGGYLESRLPETITLTDEQYYHLLEKTLLSEYGRKILNGLMKQNNEPNQIVLAETTKEYNTKGKKKTTLIDWVGDENGDEYEGDGETTTGE